MGNVNRQVKGAKIAGKSVGGQYAPAQRSAGTAPDLHELDTFDNEHIPPGFDTPKPAELDQINNHTYTLAPSSMRRLEDSDPIGDTGIRFARTALLPGGFGDLRSRNRLITERMIENRDDDACTQTLEENTLKPVTVLANDPDSGDVYVVEGKPIPVSGGGYGILPKGQRASTGKRVKKIGVLDCERGDDHRASGYNILAIEPGYGKGEKFAQQWNEVAQHFPDTQEPSADDIWSLPKDEDRDEEGAPIAQAYYLSHLGDDGFVFFATDRTEDGSEVGDQIVNGYLWSPTGSWESEHGSFRAADLMNRGGIMPRCNPSHITYADILDSHADSKKMFAKLAGND